MPPRATDLGEYPPGTKNTLFCSFNPRADVVCMHFQGFKVCMFCQPPWIARGKQTQCRIISDVI